MKKDKINFYAYLRVSTTKQDFLRQEQALNEYAKEKKIQIPKENIFADHYTGKKFNRPNYQQLKSQLKAGDYLIVKEVNRLGRNWDLIKKEWQELKNNKINIIIIDIPLLSDLLPSETPQFEGLDLRFIKEQILTLMCYSAQKDVENISRTTKEKLQAKKEKGFKLGRPVTADISINNLIKTLQLQVDGLSVNNSIKITKFPKSTFILKLKEAREKYNIYDKKELISKLKEVKEC